MFAWPLPVRRAEYGTVSLSAPKRPPFFRAAFPRFGSRRSGQPSVSSRLSVRTRTCTDLAGESAMPQELRSCRERRRPQSAPRSTYTASGGSPIGWMQLSSSFLTLFTLRLTAIAHIRSAVWLEQPPYNTSQERAFHAQTNLARGMGRPQPPGSTGVPAGGPHNGIVGLGVSLM